MILLPPAGKIRGEDTVERSIFLCVVGVPSSAPIRYLMYFSEAFCYSAFS